MVIHASLRLLNKLVAVRNDQHPGKRYGARRGKHIGLRPKLCWLLGGGALLLVAPAQAQLDLSRGQRALDGTVYEVISVNSVPLLGGVDQMRITSVAGSVNGLNACS